MAVSYVKAIAIAALAIAAAAAPGQTPDKTPKVTVSGGPDPSLHNYTWTITHDYRAPIVAVEIEHYMVDMFTPPRGFTGELTHPLGSGKCIATLDGSTRGIVRGAKALFSARVGPKGAPEGDGDILLRFADGVELTVRARVPVRPSFGERNMSLIGGGLIFGTFLLVRALKRRRAGAAGDTPATRIPPD